MNKAPKQAPPKASPVVPVVIMGVVVMVAAIAYKGFHSSAPTPPPVTPASIAENTPVIPRPHSTPAAETPEVAAAPQPTATPDPRPEPAPIPLVAPEPPLAKPKDLVSVLTNFAAQGSISADQARQWKESLQQLVRQGPASVPAIQQFLAQNLDANFAGVNGADALGYGTLRTAMLDALGQINGPDATQLMLQTLQNSLFPPDIATLAKNLDAQAPGQYQQVILDAVRQQLNLGASGQLGEANVLPLYQVLATEAANGANVSADLAQYASKWPYYSAIALSALPDGAGVPSLAAMAQGSGPGNQVAAAQALAQMAPQNSQALNTLVDLAKSGELSDTVLTQLVPYLAGRLNELSPTDNPNSGGVVSYHIANGNQDYLSVLGGGAMSPSQITQNLSAIDQLLLAVPSSDSAATEALQQQRLALAAKQKP